jgi:hypothetical protein
MVVNNFVKDMNGFRIKICMSRHYEACPLYLSALQGAPKENTSLDCA